MKYYVLHKEKHALLSTGIQGYQLLGAFDKLEYFEPFIRDLKYDVIVVYGNLLEWEEETETTQEVKVVVKSRKLKV